MAIIHRAFAVLGIVIIVAGCGKSSSTSEGSADLKSKLSDLEKLHAQKVLTTDEYERARQRAIDAFSQAGPPQAPAESPPSSAPPDQSWTEAQAKRYLLGVWTSKTSPYGDSIAFYADGSCLGGHLDNGVKWTNRFPEKRKWSFTKPANRVEGEFFLVEIEGKPDDGLDLNRFYVITAKGVEDPLGQEFFRNTKAPLEPPF